MGLAEQANRICFVIGELDASGHIDGLKHVLALTPKLGGRCALDSQSIIQVSSIDGRGLARTIDL